MSRIKTVKTVTSTLMIAVALGFLVQYDQPSVATGTDAEREFLSRGPSTTMMAINAQGQPVFGVPNVVTSPLDHAANQQSAVAVDVVYTEFAVPRLGTVMATPVPGCATTLSAQRKAAAMVDLTITSPCNEGAAFQISHEGLMFAGRTDGDGVAIVEAPALAANAAFGVSFDNVLAAEVSVFVPELRRYDRAILQWHSADNMRLHAFEGGAQIGDPRHVWSASIHAAEDTRNGDTGFVVSLGATDVEMAYRAEAYTFPADLMNREGAVDLKIGVTVNDANCGREVDARTIQTNAGEGLVMESISVQMPACDQVGSVVFFDDKFTKLIHDQAADF